ncbi:siderophore-interacting protein [Phyllobacterium sp. SB3]|uniref:siderophore-interacting protein n=1 Tax=Phyllobacterium sp. SB3 TaxID=3156073 RepID=UPI0032AF9445
MSPALLRRPESFRIGRVVAARNITPLMRRVTVEVDDLSAFDCPPRAMGPHVHALIPREDMLEQEWPIAGENGHAIYPPPERRPAVRTYSVRQFNYTTNSMDIDFVLHGDEGVASRWARNASPGDEIGLWRPHARVLENEPGRYIIAGDHTALPAIGYILDNIPDKAVGDVFIEVPDLSEQQPLRLPVGMKLQWFYSNLTSPSEKSKLPGAVHNVGRGLITESYVWLGAEASIARKVRNYVRKEYGLPASRAYILNYWKLGSVEGSYDHGE